MHEKRQNAGIAVFSGKVLMAGGFNGEMFLDSIEQLDLNSSSPEWVLLDIKLNIPSSTLGCRVVDEKECTLLVVGGQTGSNTVEGIAAIDECFILDVDDNKLTECKEVPRNVDNLLSGIIVKAAEHLF